MLIIFTPILFHERKAGLEWMSSHVHYSPWRVCAVLLGITGKGVWGGFSAVSDVGEGWLVLDFSGPPHYLNTQSKLMRKLQASLTMEPIFSRGFTWLEFLLENAVLLKIPPYSNLGRNIDILQTLLRFLYSNTKQEIVYIYGSPQN